MRRRGAWHRVLCTIALLFGVAVTARAQDVVINEIMYHPASANPRHEWLELHNRESTNVNLTGWRLVRGVDFNFPSNTIISAGGYLVVASQRSAFTNLYPTVSNVVGDWLIVRTTNLAGNTLTNFQNTLSNTRDTIELQNARGQRVDIVTYADEGDWAQRQRSLSDLGHRGWIWTSDADGAGRTLELRNAALGNEFGQNWSTSIPLGGTPGQANSVVAVNIPPMILNVAHFPVVPRSTNSISVTARILDEFPATVTVQLRWRVDGNAAPFSATTMLDNGASGDGLANDGVYAATLPPHAHGTVIEFYVEATDGQGNTRTWPAPALPAVDQPGSPAQSVNALLQVDDANYSGSAPLYKLILTAAEYSQLQTLFNSAPNSDAQMNATFISIDGTETVVRYLASTRNRGHGSRSGNPHNYRVSFRSDEPWKGGTAINLNARTPHAQHFGAVLAQKSGVAGNQSRAVQLRVNGGVGPGGSPSLGHYAANEDFGSDWADRQFPDDGGGNGYKVIRDIRPPNFDYRGTSPSSYTNTYFKQSNSSEDDWLDIITMLSVLGENRTNLFTSARAREVANVEQWFLHIAAMNLMGNGESGLNTGNNDDYMLYRGINDPRFILVYHDLDSVFGLGSLAATSDIFRPTCCPISGDTEGTWRAMNWFMRWPEFEQIYFRTLQRLIDTTFSKPQFDALIEQTLSSYVPTATINSMKSWMDQRRSYVQGQIVGRILPVTNAPLATISGEPRAVTPFRHATLTVGGDGIVSYRFRMNGGVFGAETPVSTAISLNNLPHGSTNTVFVIGKDSNNVWQSIDTPTASRTWVVNTNVPAVRLNEVLALNSGALTHHGTTPDAIELFNEGTATVNLAGLRLTDRMENPNRFTFPADTTLAAGAYLVVFANNNDGTPGLHTGFGLSGEGDSLFLLDRTTNGNAVLDSVTFGKQAANFSIGRLADGEWVLTTPTFGSANGVQALGDRTQLKINEWLAASDTTSDFIELYNPTALPVALGGLYLTDNPIGLPARSRIADLSFIPANGFTVFTANGGSGPAQVNFQLASAQGEVALLSPALDVIDSISYGPQVTGISAGGCPDGSLSYRALSLPTPGSMNACPVPPPTPPTVQFMSISNVWKYDQSGVDLGTAWRATDFNDAVWPSGPGLIGTATQNGGLPPEPTRTVVTAANGKITFYFRARFTNNVTAPIAALQVDHIVDDGAVFYLNGQEVYRYNMPGGAIGFSTLASAAISAPAQYSGPISIPATALVQGANVLAVEVHQSSGTSPDILFGTRLSVVLVTNNPSSAGVVINEVLADNAGFPEPDGSTPDWVELYNPSPSPVDLADMSLSDSPATLRRWIFPSGSIVPAQGYFRVRFQSGRPASGTNTGWGLSARGDAVYLFNSLANGGGLRDAITFGVQVADYSIARLPSGSTNWNLAVPTIGAENVAAILGDPALLKINEWMANPPSGGDDFIELFNPDGQPVALGGLWLTDDLSVRDRHRIAALSFIGTGTNAWAEFIASGNAASGPHHVNFSLRAAGEAIGLSAPNLILIDGITFGAQNEGVSEGRLPDGGTNVVTFTATVSAGAANYLLLTNVVINEVLTHTDLPFEDAIELRNLTASSISVGGWWLSDARGTPQKFQIPPGTVLPAHGFLVFYEWQFNNSDMASVPFSLSSAKGDEVYLSMVDAGGALTGYRAQVEFGAAENGVSLGRYVNSAGSAELVAMRERTFGMDNPGSVAQFRTGTGRTNAYPKVGPVVFSEIMYHPPRLGTNDNTRDEFVELRNITGASVPLYDVNFPTNRWRIRGGVDFDFPAFTSIPAGGSVVVVSFDPNANTNDAVAFRSAYSLPANVILYGPWSGKLDNGGEQVKLLKPDAPQTTGVDAGVVPYILVDAVRYSDTAPWPTTPDGTGPSLHRLSLTGYANDPTNWFAANPSPAPPSAGNGDSDGDGMPDAWEIAHGLNPNDPSDSALDSDGDGMTNLQEFRAGTNPTDASSRLAIAVSLTPANASRLQFLAVSNVSYVLQQRSSLSTGHWENVQSFTPAPANRTITITNAAPPPRFYRLVVP